MARYQDAYPSGIIPSEFARMNGFNLDDLVFTNFLVNSYPEQTRKGVKHPLSKYEEAIREFDKIAKDFDYVISTNEGLTTVSGHDGNHSYMIRAIGIKVKPVNKEVKGD